MDAEGQKNELTDVSLCYQAMGLPLSASPVQIEHRYKSLAEEYRKKIASGDAAAREEAKVSLQLLGAMYEKILVSVTYKAMEKKHNKSQPAQAPTRRMHDVVAQRGLWINCPRCNGSMVKGTQVCPVCKTPVQTTVEKITKTLLSPMMLIVYVIVVAASVTAIRLLHL